MVIHISLFKIFISIRFNTKVSCIKSDKEIRNIYIPIRKKHFGVWKFKSLVHSHLYDTNQVIFLSISFSQDTCNFKRVVFFTNSKKKNGFKRHISYIFRLLTTFTYGKNTNHKQQSISHDMSGEISNFQFCIVSITIKASYLSSHHRSDSK